MTMLANLAPAPEVDPKPLERNRLAVVSAVCGIGGFLGVTAIVAIVAGAIVLLKFRARGGVGFAIAGIVLALLWIGAGAYFGTQAYRHVAWKKQTYYDPAAGVLGRYINAVQASEYRAGRDISRDIGVREMVELKKQTLPYGKFQSLSMTGFSYSDPPGKPGQVTISGIGRFENRTASVSAEFVREKDTVLVTSLKVGK